MNRKNNAIYIDLENIQGDLDLKSLFETLSLNHRTEIKEEHIFVIKLACGNVEMIKKYESKLSEYNFNIRDTPKITSTFKNRADLIISIEALETIIVDRPSIDRYVFVTSDSDFTVIMEKLRKYGKEVCLITRENISNKPIFDNCCDEILTMEQFVINKNEKNKSDGISTKKVDTQKMIAVGQKTEIKKTEKKVEPPKIKSQQKNNQQNTANVQTIIDYLKNQTESKKRPKKIETLENYLYSHFSQKITKDKIKKAIEFMKNHKHIIITNNKIDYNI